MVLTSYSDSYTCESNCTEGRMLRDCSAGLDSWRLLKRSAGFVRVLLEFDFFEMLLSFFLPTDLRRMED